MCEAKSFNEQIPKWTEVPKAYAKTYSNCSTIKKPPKEIYSEVLGRRTFCTAQNTFLLNKRAPPSTLLVLDYVWETLFDTQILIIRRRSCNVTIQEKSLWQNFCIVPFISYD